MPLHIDPEDYILPEDRNYQTRFVRPVYEIGNPYPIYAEIGDIIAHEDAQIRHMMDEAAENQSGLSLKNLRNEAEE